MKPAAWKHKEKWLDTYFPNERRMVRKHGRRQRRGEARQEVRAAWLEKH